MKVIDVDVDVLKKLKFLCLETPINISLLVVDIIFY